MKKEKHKFNVLLWNVNSDRIEHYDILPYFRERLKERKKTKSKKMRELFPIPETLDEYMEFVKRESRYQFWARCEYEMICHGWPVAKNNHKLDIHEQVMMNLDVIAGILMEENLMKSRKTVEFERK